MLDASAGILERVEYNAYGQPRHHWRSDLDGDGDGDVDAADAAIMNNAAIGSPAIGDAFYNVDADLNRDGRVNSRDVTMFNGDGTAYALPDGALSAGDVDNVIGFSGYVYNPGALLYSVRFRCYDTNLGRWLERDPAGYVDGMNLYEYVSGAPLDALDPMGLCSDGGASGRAGRRPAPTSTRAPPYPGGGFFAPMGRGTPHHTWYIKKIGEWKEIVTPIVRSRSAWFQLMDAISRLPDWAIDPHTWLQAGGMIPVFGAVFDVADAVLYAAQGQWGQAAVSLAAAVPGAQGVTAARWGQRGVQLAKAAAAAGKPVKLLVRKKARSHSVYAAYKDGKFRKWGMTEDLATRYPKSKGYKLIVVAEGNKKDMATLEKWPYKEPRRAGQ